VKYSHREEKVVAEVSVPCLRMKNNYSFLPAKSYDTDTTPTRRHPQNRPRFESPSRASIVDHPAFRV